MSKEAMTIKAGLAVEKTRSALTDTHGLFDTSLKALINGNSAMGIPPTKDPAILSQLRTVEGLWDNFSAQIKTVANPNSSQTDLEAAIEKIITGNIPLLKEMNKAVGMYAAQSQSKVAQLTVSLYTGGIIIFVATFLIWLLINRKVVRPLRAVVEMVDGMGKGDLETRNNFV